MWSKELYGPNVLIHWEDFGNANAFRLLARYASRGATFNDDIQSTAAVTLACIIGACRQQRVPPLTEQRFLFAGAGQASLGIAAVLKTALMQEACEQGLTEEVALSRLWLTDREGLIVADRANLTPQKAEYAQPAAAAAAAGVAANTSLADSVAALKPTCLIGAAGKGGLFTQQILTTMQQSMPDISPPTADSELAPTDAPPPPPQKARPIVLALSNPTANSECTFQQAYDATGGEVVFASGSPFPPVATAVGPRFASQANNAMIFPGVGAGVVLSGAARIPDGFFAAAARSLAAETTAAEAAAGLVLPPVARLRDAALAVAAAVVIESSREAASTEAGNADVRAAALDVVRRSGRVEDRPIGYRVVAGIVDGLRF